MNQKSKGKKTKVVRIDVAHTKTEDLMEMLKVSLANKKKAS
jgi:non-homologous end joining protein Ku